MTIQSAPDQEIRNRALHPGESFILEAPAGSGKTDLLIARYLVLLSRVSHPRQILALTYTRKAAVEMENRILEKLNQAKAGKKEDQEGSWEGFLLSVARKALRKHAAHPAVLFNPDSLQVGTFHSFCSSLLKGWPVESEIPPWVDLLEEIDQEVLYERIVNQYVTAVLAGKASEEERKAYLNRLASANNYPVVLSNQLKELLRRRDRLRDFPLLTLEEKTPESLRRELLKRLEAFAGRTLSRLRGYFLDHEADWFDLKKALTSADAAMGENLPGSIPGSALEDISQWKGVGKVFLTGGGSLRKQFGPRHGFPCGFGQDPSVALIKDLSPLEARRLAFVAKWPDPREDNVGLIALTDFLILAGGAVARLEELIRTHGMDYLELELAALRALNRTDRPSESLIYHHDHLRHILVDEAQDMNDIQVEIVGRLTEGWEPGDGRTLFIVGDPKQSVYRFRRAEVGLFYELKERGLPREGEGPLPLQPLLLTANFRSRPHLVTFANRLFERVMASPAAEYDEVTFAPSVPVRQETNLVLPTTAALFYEEEGPEDLSPREREARWVAGEVARLHQSKPQETVCILIPARTHLPVFVKALTRLDLPLRLLEGEPLMQRREVRHLLNLFTAMVRPYDDLAWAAAVRAPWFWVSNQVLFELKTNDRFWSKGILGGDPAFPELARFREAVLEGNKMFGRESYSSSLSRLWEDLDGPRRTASSCGPAGISNARAFFDHLDLCSGMPGEEALVKLERLLEASYTPPDPRGAFSKISMMTIHKAKGLEFDHVLAVNLDYDPLAGGRSEQPAFRMERLPGGGRHFLVSAAADRRTGQKSLGSYLLEDLSNQRGLAEARRLFYVAATRAKESLTLTGRARPPGNGSEEAAFRTPIASLLKNVKPDGVRFRWLENPLPAGPGAIEERIPSLALTAPPFDPQPLPYRMTSPSRIEDETSQPVPLGSEEAEEGYGRARGLILHRILETLVRKKGCPDPQAIASALSSEGVPLNEAEEDAGDVMKEALRAWEDPDFRALRESADEIYSEWAIEDVDAGSTLRSGRFDLLLKSGGRWVVLDYKTGRPEKGLAEEGMEGWISTQAKMYRAQLTAYAEMVARALNLNREEIEWAILFTALPRLVREKERVSSEAP
jgi:ATP-dependent helicase/nuclease subunit A